MSPKISETVVWVSNSLDLDEMSSYLAWWDAKLLGFSSGSKLFAHVTLVVLGGLRFNLLLHTSAVTAEILWKRSIFSNKTKWHIFYYIFKSIQNSTRFYLSENWLVYPQTFILGGILESACQLVGQSVRWVGGQAGDRLVGLSGKSCTFNSSNSFNLNHLILAIDVIHKS